ncbi:hypothetical protein BY996DRAFT_6787981 [Phakopsora pachyrhizi]|nr:hypothetical protein BY996DRAFT_6787981 [Phakopsora pachyrhizi]
MNSLYSLAIRQVSNLQSELSNLEHTFSSTAATTSSTSSKSSPSNNDRVIQNGQIAASLASLQNTIDDYVSMSRSEVVESKRIKADSRIQKFREDYLGLKQRFELIKSLEQRKVEELQHSELLGMNHPNSYHNSNSSNSIYTAESPFQQQRSSLHRTNAANNRIHSNYRVNSALDENDFLKQTSSTLDVYISQGQAVLGNLGDQREMLKGTQKRLRSAANLMGLSRETIQFIERRSKGDFILFGIGVLFTFFSFFYILKFLG